MLYEPWPKTAVKLAVATANRPRATFRLRRALETPGPYKLLLGCGRTRFDGWLNTDIAWNAPMYLDATRPWPLPPGSVSHIYADNVIEHVPLSAVRSLLRHASTALQPGGLIRLTTPDIERIARLYLDGDRDFVARCLESNRNTGYDCHHPLDLLRNTFVEAGHEVGYKFDFSALSKELANAGFRDVKRAESGESDHPELRGLELRAVDTSAARELIVEAAREADQQTDAVIQAEHAPSAGSRLH